MIRDLAVYRRALVEQAQRLLPPVVEPGAMPWMTLVYLIFPLMPAVIPKFPQPNWPLTLLAIAAFLPLYFGFYWVRGWRRLGTLFAIGGLGLAMLPANPFANTFIIYSNVMAAHLPLGRMIFVILLTQCALAGGSAALGLYGDWRIFATVNLLTSVFAAGCTRVWIATARRNQALRLSQDEVRRLAQVAERERIGRDLHDLLGHTLSVVTLKAELAARLFERDAEAARREIVDVERIAREALGQVRRAVTGMRALGLRAELANARLALGAVEVDFDYRAEDLVLHPETETALALALREAATNVIRHAQARRCHAALSRIGDEVRLVVRDDGLGGARADGNGLRGIAERAEALGGSLRVDSVAGQGTELEIRVPWRERPEAPPRDEGARPRLAVVR